MTITKAKLNKRLKGQGEKKMKNLQKDMTRKQLEVRIATINTLIAAFGDEDGKLAKELNEAYKKLEKH